MPYGVISKRHRTYSGSEKYLDNLASQSLQAKQTRKNVHLPSTLNSTPRRSQALIRAGSCGWFSPPSHTRIVMRTREEGRVFTKSITGCKAVSRSRPKARCRRTVGNFLYARGDTQGFSILSSLSCSQLRTARVWSCEPQAGSARECSW